MTRSRLQPTDTPSAPPARGDRDAGGGRSRPLLLADIDGVISLFGFVGQERPAGSFHAIDGIPHFLSADAGQHLLDLSASFDLAWCSGWEEKANEYLPHLLGLPGPLPHLSFDRAPGRGNAHWKLDAIEDFAGPRAVAWVDDAFNDACRVWAVARAAPTLLVATDPARGLTAGHVARLQAWARALARDGDGDGDSDGATTPRSSPRPGSRHRRR
jgi:hypothetical protein